jgi:hypothetical protein
MKWHYTIGTLSLVAIAMVSPVQAALLNAQTIETSYRFPDTLTLFGSPVNSVVGAGLELANFVGFVDIDFSDTNILITARRDAGVNNVAFDGLRFTDINNLIPAFTGVTLNALTNYAGFDASRVTFDANTILVNVANLPGLNGQIISIDLSSGATAVPEPSATLGLLAAALLIAGTSRLQDRARRGLQ